MSPVMLLVVVWCRCTAGIGRLPLGPSCAVQTAAETPPRISPILRSVDLILPLLLRLDRSRPDFLNQTNAERRHPAQRSCQSSGCDSPKSRNLHPTLSSPLHHRAHRAATARACRSILPHLFAAQHHDMPAGANVGSNWIYPRYASSCSWRSRGTT